MSDHELRQLLGSRIGTAAERPGDRGVLAWLDRRHESMHLLPSGSTGTAQWSETGAAWAHKRGRPRKDK